MENNFKILEKELQMAVDSSTYSLVVMPGESFSEREELYDILIDLLLDYYDEDEDFEPHDCSIFPTISNFNIICSLPIRFFYKILFETDLLYPKVLSDRNDKYFLNADMNFMQSLYFHKSFMVDTMNPSEYKDTFTLLCLVDPNILLAPIDVESEDELWDLTPFVEYCTTFGYSMNHIGEALSILEKEDQDVVKQFIATNIYNFKAYEPLLKKCSKQFLLDVPALITDVPEDVIHNYYSYVYDRK